MPTKSTIPNLFTIFFIIIISYSLPSNQIAPIIPQSGIQSIIMLSLFQQITILSPFSQQINQDFRMDKISALSCKMPDLYIYQQSKDHHSSYQLITVNLTILNIKTKYWDIQTDINCLADMCTVNINNLCKENQNRYINWVMVSTSDKNYNFQYLVNCKSDQYYKPFQWGLFILICICSVIITMASLFSRAWSYGGFGININMPFLIVFNFMVIIGSIAAYYLPALTSTIVKIAGTVIGVVGVAICVSETLWLARNPKLNNNAINLKIIQIRMLDVVSFIIGIIFMVLYWVTDGAWIVNDVLAVCIIVAAIKILKVRSMRIGVLMLFSLLLIQIIMGLIIHYGLKVSYNNLIIQLFQSPLVIVFPSITPQIQRRCAWLPVTSLIFPALFISYLRRFDKSRGTFLYLIIGYVSFYVGSIIWMILDMSTQHTLPLAIISDPIVTIAVIFIGNRRNQLQTLWSGMFYDPQLPDFSEDILLPDHYSNFNMIQNKAGNNQASRYTLGMKQITEDLKISHQPSQEI